MRKAYLGDESDCKLVLLSEQLRHLQQCMSKTGDLTVSSPPLITLHLSVEAVYYVYRDPRGFLQAHLLVSC